ncbi:hypothetical protein Dimus_038576 [Dionaea muscipula]
MNEGESITEMYARFTKIMNSLKGFGKNYSQEDKVKKILRVLPKAWSPKVTAIQECKNLKTLSIDTLIGSLLTYEAVLKEEEPSMSHRKEKTIALQVKESDSDEGNIEDMAMFIRSLNKGFKKWKFNNKNSQKGKKLFNNVQSKSSRSNKRDDNCYKCGKLGHMIKECPTWKDDNDHEENLKYKKKWDTKKVQKAMMVAAAAAWGDSDSDNSEPEACVEEQAHMGYCLMANKEDDAAESTPLED